ncbi:TrbI/VirB10 family protein [Bradyrhizobium ivorense]|uniref:TrbI/VirB10 family protein n=1 Tax=Bradyrhizobium ivorense TaxID=2511166 RepID=UPI001E28CD2D|nr:TrbI/VirB10 family protein [Bradyrhizobium ivorense]
MGANGGMGGMGGGMGGIGGNGGDPNKQAEKKAFLAQTPEADVYLKSTRQAGISPALEVKAGTVIPGVMIGGINSDLPGQIIGQVRENVYDSATGQNLLIPAGARLIGTYDNGVTLGQSRVLVAWTRVIYPDGSSLSLNTMPGADQSGYAGFNDKVNNHYWRIFGNGLMLSLFSAGVQLSQPQSNGSQNGYDSQQIIAGALGQQMGQLGMEMTRRNLDIQPTLEIRPGYLFNVMVTKDIVLPPWQGHPLAQR